MKHIEISDIHMAADFFNEYSKRINTTTPYRVVDSKDGQNTISNVPHDIYNNPCLRKYSPPQEKLLGSNSHFISFLHQGFDFFNSNHPEAHLRYEDGKIFHYNKCYDNSLGGYFCLLNLAANNN